MSSSEAVDIQQIMREIRERVKKEAAQAKDSLPELKREPTDFDAGKRKAGELLHSEELRYLNQHHAYGLSLNPDAITSHRPGIIGKLIVGVKRRVLRLLWDKFLRSYIAAEKDYQTHLVRFLNDASKYVDARDADNFWQVIRKIDVDLTNALERIEQIGDEQGAELRSTEREMSERIDAAVKEVNDRVRELQKKSAQHDALLTTLQGVTAGLESILNQAGREGALPRAKEGAVPEPRDYSYQLLENRFRGSEEVIQQRMEMYAEALADSQHPVLELGPGRGELLSLLQKQGVSCYGVDTDEAMVEAGRAKSLDVRLGDGIAHLRTCDDKSLGAIVAIQVVEHLPRVALEELCTLAARKLVAGGQVIFETINPQSVLALSSNYFRDPTHVFPQHPDTLEYQLSLSGLQILERRYLSPVASEASLQEITVEAYMTPRWAETVERLNANLKQLNELLYGFQDYAVFATPRAEGE